MERYIGLDVHLQSCTLVVLGPSGRRLSSTVIETNGRQLIQAVKQVPGEKHLCLEEGTQSAWVYELLEPEVEDLAVVMPPKRQGTKSDRLDAWDLANQLRIGAAQRRVYKHQGPFRGLRQAVHWHLMITSDVVRAKNRLKAIYRSRGLHKAGDELYRAETREAWVEKLPVAHQTVARALGEELDGLEELREEAEKWLRVEGHQHPDTRLVATAPGIGPIRAAQIVATVVTPHRFRTKRQFWSYCGLAVTTHASAEYCRAGSGALRRWRHPRTVGLNSNRQPLLKSVFKGAAHQIVTHMATHPLAQQYCKAVEGGADPAVAKVAVARRVAAAVLSMWKHGEVYDPAKHQLRPSA